SYDWPGNVRELRNVLERALIVSSGETPGADLLSQLLESALSTSRSGSLVAPGDLHLRRNLDGRERELIEAALARAGQRKKDAASMLGIDARNLGYYLRKHDLQTPDRGDP
ncbi:MAG: sigma-54-dependent Fis family transcriptional regulator, partial [Planctomycetes bacterium]|nr:sigma-54-dependent Fis family transcriptional regulator [Planctomycetota bacterium]